MKKRVEDLAVFGGKPAFSEKLHVGRPNLGDRRNFLRRVNEVLDRNWLTNNGPCVHELEQRISEMIGVRHCIAMCNATIALEIAARAAGLCGEVIVPSMTFVATAHALQWQEITPVFCDIDPETHNLDPVAVEKMITPRTSGIIGVHLWGRPCNVDALADVANARGLKLLFDAAHAFGNSSNGRMIGSFGLAEIFSFHATKFFNTFEGGAVATNDDELASKIRLMKNFGFSGYDNVIYIGTNGKMSELSAAMGLAGLDALADIIAKNRHNYELYQKEFSIVPEITMVNYPKNEQCNCQYIVIEVDNRISTIERDLIVEILHAENIIARRYFYPGCHQMEPYRTLFPQAHLLLPHTSRLVDSVISFPTGTAVGADEIKIIGEVLRFILTNGKEITRCKKVVH